MRETVFLVGFFRFNDKGSSFGFERMDLHHIFKTEEAARTRMSFCDEAGWYEGALIEERAFSEDGWFFRGKRIWLLQDKVAPWGMTEIEEPKWFNNIGGLIG